MSAAGWIGVDFDGTLAEHVADVGLTGSPVPAMTARVRKWLDDGIEVRILTARVACSGATNDAGDPDDAKFAAAQRRLLEAWCLRYLGRVLPITASKDFRMVALFDDRAVQVEPNTGRLMAAEGWD